MNNIWRLIAQHEVRSSSCDSPTRYGLILTGSEPAPEGCIYPSDADEWKLVRESGKFVGPVLRQDGWFVGELPASESMLSYASRLVSRNFALNGPSALWFVLRQIGAVDHVTVQANEMIIQKVFTDPGMRQQEVKGWVERCAQIYGDRFRYDTDQFAIHDATLPELCITSFLGSYSPYASSLQVTFVGLEHCLLVEGAGPDLADLQLWFYDESWYRDSVSRLSRFVLRRENDS